MKFTEDVLWIIVIAWIVWLYSIAMSTCAVEDCTDMEDNDLDLLIDCDDPDCASYHECSGEMP